MFKAVRVTNHLGESLKMEIGRPQDSGFNILDISGLGAPKADINMTDIATADGAVFNSARAEARNIVFTIGYFEQMKAGWDIESLRHKSYKFFPIKRRVELEFETTNRTSRIIGYTESNQPNIFSREEGAQISVICPDPYFYLAGSSELHKVEFGSRESLFEFVFSNESLTDPLIEFSRIIINPMSNVLYTGDADVGFILRMHAIGPVTNPSFIRPDTYEQIKIDSAKLEKIVPNGIQAGDDIIISTVSGSKSAKLVRGGEVFNILNSLGRDISWMKLQRGDNVFTYKATSGALNLQLEIEHYTVFEGV